MARIVNPGLIEGLKIDVDKDGKESVSYQLHVAELEGNTPQLRLHSALTAPGMPQQGDNSSIPGLVVRTLSLVAWGNDEGVVTITEGPPDASTPKPPGGGGSGNGGNPVEVEIGSVAEQIETEFDAANRKLPEKTRSPLFVKYLGPGETEATDPTSDEYKFQNRRATISAFVPKSTLVLSRMEEGSPGKKSRRCVGKINSAPFFGEDEGTILCYSITGRSADGGKTYRVVYTFICDPVGKWRQVVRWTNPLTGDTPRLTSQDVGTENGIKFVDAQDQMDFNTLKLKPRYPEAPGPMVVATR